MSAPEQLKTLQNRDPLAKRSNGIPATELVRTAVDGILDKKGDAIAIMDMRSVSGVADFFVICTGSTDVQIKAIANEVRQRVRDEHGERPWHVEGMDSLQWVLLDYVDVVVHVMMAETREFYGLERLWGDAPIEQIDADTVNTHIAMFESGDSADNPS